MTIKFPTLKFSHLDMELTSAKILSIALNAFIVLSFLLLQGCAVYSVAATTTKAVAKTAGAAVTVATAPVRILAGDKDDNKDDDDN